MSCGESEAESDSETVVLTPRGESIVLSHGIKPAEKGAPMTLEEAEKKLQVALEHQENLKLMLKPRRQSAEYVMSDTDDLKHHPDYVYDQKHKPMGMGQYLNDADADNAAEEDEEVVIYGEDGSRMVKEIPLLVDLDAPQLLQLLEIAGIRLSKPMEEEEDGGKIRVFLRRKTVFALLVLSFDPDAPLRFYSQGSPDSMVQKLARRFERMVKSYTLGRANAPSLKSAIDPIMRRLGDMEHSILAKLEQPTPRSPRSPRSPRAPRLAFGKQKY